MDNTEIQLPKNWIIKKSRSRGDKIYYFNTATGESVWKLPIHEMDMDKSKGHRKDKGYDGLSTSSSKSILYAITRGASNCIQQFIFKE